MPRMAMTADSAEKTVARVLEILDKYGAAKLEHLKALLATPRMKPLSQAVREKLPWARTFGPVAMLSPCRPDVPEVVFTLGSGAGLLLRPTVIGIFRDRSEGRGRVHP